jgi:hypothetical protein
VEGGAVLEGHKGPVSSLRWSRTGDRLASGAYDSTVRVWPVGGGGDDGLVVDADGVWVLKGHIDWVMALAWSQNGSHLASASYDNTIRVWMVAGNTEDITGSDAPHFQLLQGHTDGVLSLAWSACGTWLASGSADFSVRVWRMREDGGGVDLTRVQVLDGHSGQVGLVSWAANGKCLASASQDGSVRVWHVGPDGAAPHASEELMGHGGMITSTVWSPDGAHLVTGSLDDGDARVWAIGLTNVRKLFLHALRNVNLTLTRAEVSRIPISAALWEL